MGSREEDLHHEGGGTRAWVGWSRCGCSIPMDAPSLEHAALWKLELKP